MPPPKGLKLEFRTRSFVLEKAFWVEDLGIGPPDVFVEMQLAVGYEDLGAAA